MRSLSDGNTERVGKREKRGAQQSKYREGVYRKKKKRYRKRNEVAEGKEQQDAGQGGEEKQASDPHHSDPLTTRSRPREPNPLSALLPRSRPALFNRLCQF